MKFLCIFFILCTLSSCMHLMQHPSDTAIIEQVLDDAVIIAKEIANAPTKPIHDRQEPF